MGIRNNTMCLDGSHADTSEVRQVACGLQKLGGLGKGRAEEIRLIDASYNDLQTLEVCPFELRFFSIIFHSFFKRSAKEETTLFKTQGGVPPPTVVHQQEGPTI